MVACLASFRHDGQEAEEALEKAEPRRPLEVLGFALRVESLGSLGWGLELRARGPAL